MGSEMCIRDSPKTHNHPPRVEKKRKSYFGLTQFNWHAWRTYENKELVSGRVFQWTTCTHLGTLTAKDPSREVDAQLSSIHPNSGFLAALEEIGASMGKDLSTTRFHCFGRDKEYRGAIDALAAKARKGTVTITARDLPSALAIPELAKNMKKRFTTFNTPASTSPDVDMRGLGGANQSKRARVSAPAGPASSDDIVMSATDLSLIHI